MINIKKLTIKNPSNKNTYPYSTPIFQTGFSIKIDSLITIIVGDNGIGKSTLLEAIATKIGFSSFGGSASHTLINSDIHKVIKNSYARGFHPKSGAELLDEDRTVIENLDNVELSNNIEINWTIKTNKGLFIRSETFANLISLPRFNVETLSHGEGIIKILEDIKDNGIYILDEPEAGLSPLKIIKLMSIIKNKADNYNSQFIIATHNPILMCLPSATLYQLTENNFDKISPEESEHFILTKRILNNKDEFIDRYFK